MAFYVHLGFYLKIPRASIPELYSQGIYQKREIIVYDLKRNQPVIKIKV